MSAIKNTISFPSAPELVHRSLSQDSVASSSSSEGIQTPTSESGHSFDDKFGGECGLTVQQLVDFIKYTLLNDPPLLNDGKGFLTIRMNELEVESLFNALYLESASHSLSSCLLYRRQTADHLPPFEQGLECTRKLVNYSRFRDGLPKYTITKSNHKKNEEKDLPPLVRNFGSLCLQQFPEFSPRPFVHDSDSEDGDRDEDEDKEKCGSGKDILYI
ncbi:hypothetical protein QFC22_003633 [Naganishia vaughanmartiniae]|uniref:Uncharacterized protein n=1 Tax=Naganishia vaughanmartiniae TaxID=1424756 RepID=A0ACC2X798_9TREE|nr:hypothetical protein QFC22_003633 [Naganishia vaughanmartiniae]